MGVSKGGQPKSVPARGHCEGSAVGDFDPYLVLCYVWMHVTEQNVRFSVMYDVVA